VTPGTTPAQARLGFLEAVAAAALWGSSGIFAVELFSLGVTPASLALLRMALGTLFLVIWAASARRRELPVSGRDLLILLVGGGLPMAGFQVVYQHSIDSVGVPTTVALLYLAPVFVVAASAPLLRERPTPLRVALSVLVVAGVWLTVLGADEVQAVFGSRSLAWGVLAGVCYAGYTLFGRFAAPRWGSVATVVYASLGATLLLTATVPLLSDTTALPQGGRAWGVLVVFALLTVTLASLLFFDALRRIEASRVAVAAAAEPVVAALLATLILSQGLDVTGWLGIGLVTGGVAAVGFSDGDAGRSPSPGVPTS
jgi:DME family drug/metabolite transporter